MAKSSKKFEVKDLIDVLIYVLFAVVVLPIIASQVTTLEGDTGNFSATEILLLALITTFIVLGIVYGIVKKML
ncbi:MAG: hypothetical protein KGD67_11675 [Candidatus Lokiarchaeota archaeon]|nr:hypothetical protein [Candidatus Lokiarchaeota archaeon]